MGINIAEKRKTVQQYVDHAKIEFPVLLDSKSQISKRYGVRGTPTHFLIDKKGIIRAYAPGYKDVASQSSRKMIEHIIKEDI